jgi:metallo-beta-lactamase family protein
VQLEFHGAARSVTGSCYRLDLGEQRLLVDCGMFQERAWQERNWQPFGFDPAAIDVTLLTHCHIDHIGRLPLLAKQGYHGRTFATAASVDLAELMLLDAAHIQEEDAKFKNKRHAREGRDVPPAKPLFTVEDADNALDDLVAVAYDKRVEVLDGVFATWRDAGHMLGSASLLLEVERGGARRSFWFSGDVGAPGRAILRDPRPFELADYVVCESTYGDRLHEPQDEVLPKLREVVLDTVRRGGNLVVPSFAVGRTQQLLYHLRHLMVTKQIPMVLTFVDSPMAVEATAILREHPECFDDEAQALIAAAKDPVGFGPLHFSSSREQSKAINNIRGSAIIISASGMCNAGRIKHHLAANISRRDSTILFVGYQAEHTLGRQIIEGASEVRILGELRPVRARIAKINGLSGHADRDGLLAWLGALQQPPRHVFITHGDDAVTQRFAALVAERYGWPTSAPACGEAAAV